jgi:ribonuclease Z
VAPYLPFDVRCRDLSPGDTFELDGLRGLSTLADHHVTCMAYRLDLPRRREFLPERAQQLGVPIEYWKLLQGEKSVSFDGRTVLPDEVLGDKRRGLAIALVTDTRPTSALEQLAAQVDLLLCEGTYGDDEDQPRAIERKHMTFSEAARLAQCANVQQLLLTHFSPAVVDPNAYLEQATRIFQNTTVGRDHYTLSLKFSED